MMRFARRFVLPILSATLYASAALAQTSNPYRNFQFSPPGARSTGMGIAFVALADDATACSANPSGLTVLMRPEVSAHLRYARYKTFGGVDTDQSSTNL